MNLQQIIGWFKKYPMIVGSMLLSLLMVALLLSSTNTIPQKKVKIEQLGSELAIMQANQKAALTMGEDLKRIEQKVQYVDARLMNPNDTTKIFSYFLSLENQSNVKISDPVQVSVGLPPVSPMIVMLGQKNEKNICIIKYQMNVTGSLKNILHYMQKIDTGNYYSRISEFKLTRSSLDTTQSDLTASIIISILGQRN